MSTHPHLPARPYLELSIALCQLLSRPHVEKSVPVLYGGPIQQDDLPAGKQNVRLSLTPEQCNCMLLKLGAHGMPAGQCRQSRGHIQHTYSAPWLVCNHSCCLFKLTAQSSQQRCASDP
jgi:hypothetical protein